MRKYISIALLILVGVGAFIVYPYYQTIFAPTVHVEGDTPYELFIYNGMDYTDVGKQLLDDKVISDPEGFHWVAEQMNYPNHVYSGRYLLRDGMSNRELVTLLRSGKQVPIKFTFVKFRTVEDLARYAGTKFAFTDIDLLGLLQDNTYLDQFGLNQHTAIAIFIPNTYEMYWNISAEQFFNRMLKEYRNFWNDARNKKRGPWGLTRLEIMTLASIVEEETNMNDEKKRMAGVYLNRVRKKWPLEADPTVKFALKNFEIKRVLNSHLEVDSPFNTYMYEGIPPGPICTPSPASIDGVLSGERHSYMFFCAKADFSGYHHYSKTLAEHNRYAQLYHQKLNERAREERKKKKANK